MESDIENVDKLRADIQNLSEIIKRLKANILLNEKLLKKPGTRYETAKADLEKLKEQLEKVNAEVETAVARVKRIITAGKGTEQP